MMEAQLCKGVQQGDPAVMPDEQPPADRYATDMPANDRECKEAAD